MFIHFISSWFSKLNAKREQNIFSETHVEIWSEPAENVKGERREEVGLTQKLKDIQPSV
jgi:hypothetical protein